MEENGTGNLEGYRIRWSRLRAIPLFAFTTGHSHLTNWPSFKIPLHVPRQGSTGRYQRPSDTKDRKSLASPHELIKTLTFRFRHYTRSGARTSPFQDSRLMFGVTSRKIFP